MNLPKTVNELATILASLPGIGPKSAQRIALYMANNRTNPRVTKLPGAIEGLLKHIKKCELCNMLTESEVCNICSDPKRIHSKVVVVENTLEVLSYEGIGYDGLYHSLDYLLSPLNGIGVEKLEVNLLINRLKGLIDETGHVEVIMGFSTSLEGEATSALLKQVIKSKLKSDSISISRPSRGLPANANIEYLDESTLKNSLTNRTPLS